MPRAGGYATWPQSVGLNLAAHSHHLGALKNSTLSDFRWLSQNLRKYLEILQPSILQIKLKIQDELGKTICHLNGIELAQ